MVLISTRTNRTEKRKKNLLLCLHWIAYSMSHVWRCSKTHCNQQENNKADKKTYGTRRKWRSKKKSREAARTIMSVEHQRQLQQRLHFSSRNGNSRTTTATAMTTTTASMAKMNQFPLFLQLHLTHYWSCCHAFFDNLLKNEAISVLLQRIEIDRSSHIVTYKMSR